MKVLIAAFCLIFVASVVAENDTIKSSFDELSNENCIVLNQQRLDLRQCCTVPKIPFFEIFSTHCIDECIGSQDICCSMICLWRNAHISFNGDQVNLDGLKKTFLNSVVHKDDWEDLISKAVDQCDAETQQGPLDKLCKIPTHLPGVVNCAVKKLFLMCPNMHKSEKCENTKKYVEECL